MYDKSILAKSTGASLGVVAIVGLLFLSTGTAFATPVAGIGGFTIEANSITGNNLILYPGTSEAENTSGVSENSSFEDYKNEYPVGIVELKNTEIDGLELTKVFDLQNYTKLAGSSLLPGKARIKIVSSGPNVTTNSIIIKTPQIAADNATFSGLEIKENNVSPADPASVTRWLELRTQEQPEGPIEDIPGQNISNRYNYSGGTSPGLILQDPFIRATYLATDSITIPNLRLEVQYNPDNDDVYEWAS